MNVQKLEKIRKIVGIIYLITMAGAVAYMCYGIYTIKSAGAMTSFPWWSACYFALICFGPFLVFELFLFVMLSYYIRKNQD